MEDELAIIVVTLALGLVDNTWQERDVECSVSPNLDPDSPTEGFSLEDEAFNVLMRNNEDEINKLAPSFYKMIHWEWKEERADRPCDADCARRLAENDSVECTCSRQKTEEATVFKVDNKIVKVGNDVRVEVSLPDGDNICVILTHEGVVIDAIRNGDIIATSSATYEERFGFQVNEDEE